MELRGELGHTLRGVQQLAHVSAARVTLLDILAEKSTATANDEHEVSKLARDVAGELTRVI